MQQTTYLKLLILSLCLFLLSGCLYPSNELAKNQVPNEQQLQTIQTAVDTYVKENNGLLPIKTKNNDTQIFEKYLIDFNILKEHNLISEVPGNAYENGGVYQYAILYPEDDPQVKLIDLRLTEEIRRVNVQLDLYRDKHIYPPFGEEVVKGIYTIDYEKLGLESSPHVKSPYFDNQLPIVMDTEGKLLIDYRVDLNEALKTYDHDEYENGDDIRFILAENSPFLPAYSAPYTIKDDEPVFMNN